MKTKAQKNDDLKRGEELLKASEAVLFFDFSKVSTGDLKNLRRELKEAGSPMLVMKKRLLSIAFKNQGLEVGELPKTSVATVFASNLEGATAAVYKFFRALEQEKKIEGTKLIGGFDMKAKSPLTKAQVVAIGQLPPREVLLAQLLGMIAAPIRSFLYVLDQKSKQTA